MDTWPPCWENDADSTGGTWQAHWPISVPYAVIPEGFIASVIYLLMCAEHASSTEPLHRWRFSTVAILDDIAHVVERISYSPYGETRHHNAANRRSPAGG